jgi:hypothetical protein
LGHLGATLPTKCIAAVCGIWCSAMPEGYLRPSPKFNIVAVCGIWVRRRLGPARGYLRHALQIWGLIPRSQGHFAPLPPILTFLLLRLGSGDVATPGQTQGFRNHLAPCAPAVLHLTPLSPKVTLPRFVNFSIRQGLIPRPSGAPFPKLKAVGLFKFGAA